jgi:hypothetical protein
LRIIRAFDADAARVARLYPTIDALFVTVLLTIVTSNELAASIPQHAARLAFTLASSRLAGTDS